MLQVIGAGFGRTGTHSLAAALEILGYGPCYHMLELRHNPDRNSVWANALDGKQVDWKSFFQSYKSSVEWPAVAFLNQILQEFPKAKVILTLRDAEDWYESANATIFDGLALSRFNPDPTQRERGGLARRLILDGVFSGKHREKEHAIAVYKQHIDRVIGMVPAESLLLYRIGEGWEPLCEFLGVKPPEEDFPWLHERKQFMSTEPRWAKEIREKRAADLRSSDKAVTWIRAD